MCPRVFPLFRTCSHVLLPVPAFSYFLRCVPTFRFSLRFSHVSHAFPLFFLFFQAFQCAPTCSHCFAFLAMCSQLRPSVPGFSYFFLRVPWCYQLFTLFSIFPPPYPTCFYVCLFFSAYSHFFFKFFAHAILLVPTFSHFPHMFPSVATCSHFPPFFPRVPPCSHLFFHFFKALPRVFSSVPWCCHMFQRVPISPHFLPRDPCASTFFE